jgi:hypothetical protein
MTMGDANQIGSVAPCSFCKGTRQMVSTFWDDVKQWARAPYSDNMNALHWILFLGFMLCITFLWSRVIRSILA